MGERLGGCRRRLDQFSGSNKEDADMRAIMIAMHAALAMLAARAIGLFGPSGVSAAPANGAAIGEAAAAVQMIEKTRRYRRDPHRRRVPYYSYRYYEPSGTSALHQLSQENQQRAQQNGAEGAGAGGGGGEM